MSILAERLTAQLLAGPAARNPAAVAERLLAIQAQDPRGARLAIRARSTGLSVADVDRELTEQRSLLITWLNRGDAAERGNERRHMTAVDLDRLTWPEVKAEIEGGRDTVVIALGATEQHGPHLPLATDALIGDHLARRVADELDAFVAPTVWVGCSEHHLAFPGTLSVSEDTFHAVVADLVRSLARGGFRRVVLLPTHGGNFGPLAAALEKLGPVEGLEVRALTDLGALLAIAQLGQDEHGVPISEGGLHAGEWETSLVMSIHPDLVHLERGQAGYTGDMEAAVGAIFGSGVHSVAANGVIGDPVQASPDHGARYWEKVTAITLEAVGRP